MPPRSEPERHRDKAARPEHEDQCGQCHARDLTHGPSRYLYQSQKEWIDAPLEMSMPPLSQLEKSGNVVLVKS